MYRFEKVDFDEVERESKGISIISIVLFDSEEYYDNIFKCMTQKGDDCSALFFGKCKALFGEPNHISKDNDYLYIYCIKATAKDGSYLYLCPYHGEKGSSVFLPSELNDIDIEPYYVALNELIDLINKTYSVDYVWKFHSKIGFKEFMTYKVVCNTAFNSHGYMDDFWFFQPNAKQIYEKAKEGYY